MKVRLSGLNFWAYHGVLKAERRLGGPFQVDMEIEVRIPAPGRDRLSDTVDYRAIHALAKRLMEGRKFRTLEALAFTLAKSVVRMPKVEEAFVRVAKLAPPLSTGAVSAAEVRMSRDAR